LIALQRTREDSQINFEWAYKAHEKGSDYEPANTTRLSAGEVMPGLDSSVEHVATAISRHITTALPKPASFGPVSLLLSTGRLSRTTEVTDEVRESHQLPDLALT
jgi:hypothetical protein